MFNTTEFGGAGKRLNAEYLKSVPQMAIKGTIVGGGVKEFDSDKGTGKDRIPYLTITSSAYEGEKELSLNATNRSILAAAYGTNANAWVGKEIGIWFDPTVTFGGKAVGGVKVKPLNMPDPFATPAPAPAALEEVPF